MSPATLEHRAQALRALAALLRLGYPVRSALIEWARHAPDSMRADLTRLRRAICIGVPTPAAVKRLRSVFEQDAGALESTLKISATLGGDTAAMVESLARSIDSRRASLSAARSASSGAKLSGRLIAGLPLAFLPLVPMGGRQLLTGANRLPMIFGVGLLVAGLMWIARLMPRPDAFDDPHSALADLLAAVLAGGSSLPSSLDAICKAPPEGLQVELARARRLARIGFRWPNALERAGDVGLGELGAALARAQRMGLPVAGTLVDFADDRRAERDRRFEAKNKRAIVLMVIPLTVCVLPAFILLGIAPFLRGLSLG